MLWQAQGRDGILRSKGVGRSVQAGRYALHFILEEANVSFVDVPEPFPVRFANVNTPEGYKRIQEVMAKKT